ncbi:60S ribosomal protein L6, putative [Eimeria mitis]|uniref:60S ribosomal protein L6 n=1 Tax=Eimeria mitis TaxID=44415 RepID=U6JRL9_9EIME|nr:60S ribosomal protein L6, putative [Eimeria mitis]CDJ28110.1 60S ribosomal protein L6, putative [Eimeria mitis]
MSQAKKTTTPGAAAAAGGQGARAGRFRLRRKNKRVTDLKRQAMGKTSCKLRKSITPGTVLILLSSGYRGKRVICLKQLEPSGLLLVSGPFTVNGVPLRRVNQRYVIATSTKVDVSGVDLSGISDSLFTRTAKEKREERKMRTKDDTSLFVQQDTSAQKKLPEERKKLQERVDKALLAVVNKDALLKQYLKTRFTLRANMAPHAMKF